jgi:transmembrane 9 superfamily protein 1
MNLTKWSTRFGVFTLLMALDCSSETREGASVNVFMNKVWPLENPVETYRYTDFPLCQSMKPDDSFMSFGQILRGDRLSPSLYEISFLKSSRGQQVCSKQFSEEEVKSLSSAIQSGYVYEIYVADLPVVIALGSLDPNKRVNLCNHVKFEISHRESQVVGVNAQCAEEVQLKSSVSVTFYYSVEWIERKDMDPADSWWRQQLQLANLMAYLKTGRQSSSSAQINISIHWISIVNSLILALLMVLLVVIILFRIVRSDFSSNFMHQDPELASTPEPSEADDVSWKLLHGDVFRPPVHRMWLCACVGAGTQLLFVGVSVILIGAVGNIYSQRGTVVSAAVVLYMLSAAIAGFVSARLYHRIGGVKWKWNMIVTALLFTGPSFIVWSILNTVAIFYSSTAALPFLTILQLFAMWGLVTIPLTVIGGTLGRQQAIKWVKQTPFPVKTNRIPREVPKPDSMIYSPVVQLIVVGFLSFLSIYLELKYIFKSVWGAGFVYTLFGILIVSLVLLFLLATVLTVLFTYFQLNAEDYRWWWRSFISGGSVGVFIYMYAIYFYLTSGMSGGLQSTFFFLYSALIAYAVSLCVGAASFSSSYKFVWFIYKNLKTD